MSESQWTVIDIGVAQIGETRDLFKRVFGQQLSEALWRWKYDAGRGVGVGARAPNGDLLAHYGGTLRQINFCDQPALAIQIGDVMVAPEGRAALAHKGPFGMVVEAFLNRHVGGAKGVVLGFGFPNARHMRLGEKLGHYVQVDTVSELSWHVPRRSDNPNKVTTRLRIEALDWANPLTEVRLDGLWRKMKHDLRDSVVPTRDASWLRHRYANHPEHRYVCFWVRSIWLGRLLGAMVLRSHPPSATQGPTATTWELIDWVAPKVKSEEMLLAAMEVVRQRGGTLLMGWFSSMVANSFTTAAISTKEACTAGVTVPGPNGRFQITNSFGLTVSDLRGNWWLTGGDTDFR